MSINYEVQLVPYRKILLGYTIDKINKASGSTYIPTEFQIESVSTDTYTGVRRWIVEASYPGKLHLRLYVYLNLDVSTSNLYYEASITNNLDLINKEIQVIDPNSDQANPSYLTELVTERLVTHQIHHTLSDGTTASTEAILKRAAWLLDAIKQGSVVPDNAIFTSLLNDGMYISVSHVLSLAHTGDLAANYT